MTGLSSLLPTILLNTFLANPIHPPPPPPAFSALLSITPIQQCSMISKDKGAFSIKRRVNFSKHNSLAHKQMPNDLTSDQTELVASPSNIVFHNYEPDHVHINKFTVRNQSRKSVAYRIVEPASIAFRVKAEGKGLVHQGEAFEVYVYFKNVAKENNTVYHDRVYINHGNGCLEVQIQAIPPKDHKKVSLLLNEDELRRSIMTIKKRLNSSNNNMGSSKQSSFTKTVSETETVMEEFYSSKECQAEHEFCKRFTNLTAFMKDKNMKIQSFIGNQPLQQSYINTIISNRQKAAQAKANHQKLLIMNRVKIEFLDECPIIDRGQNKIVRWNESMNDMKRIKNNGVKKMLSCVKKCIANFRVQRAKQAWQKYVVMQGTVQEKIQVVLADIEAMRKSRRKMDIKMQMNFSTKSLQLVSYPSELAKIDTPPAYNGGNFYFEVNPRIGFDDWIPMEELAENYQQMMKYQNEPYPSLYEYVPIKADRMARYGAENEYSCHGFDLQEDFSTEMTITSTNQPQQTTATRYLPRYPILPAQQSDNALYLHFPSDDPTNTHLPFPSVPPSHLSARTLTPLSFELCHYIKPHIESQYDCCFEQHVQKHLDYILGGGELDDRRILEGEVEEGEVRELVSLKEEVYGEEEFVPGELHREHTIITAIEKEFENYKLEKLKVVNAHVRSVNRFVKERENKLIF